MFNTAGSFSAVYLILTAALFVLVLFEKHFIRLEDKIKAKKNVAKKPVGAVNTRNKVASKTNTSKKSNSTATIRRVPHNAA